MAISETDAVQ